MPLHYVVPEKKTLLRSSPLAGEEEGLGLSWVEFLHWFGENIRHILGRVDISLSRLEEIRLRARQPLLLRLSGRDVFLGPDGQVCAAGVAYRVELSDISETLERLTQSSLYAAEDNIRQGFLTLPGGHRVGLTGEAIIRQGNLQTLKHITGLNFRIAREIRGLGLELLPYLISPDARLRHTVILSSPRAGKTTLLRALIRWLSNGVPELGLPGQTVGVVDERGELAGQWQGLPAYDLGCRTDVLDACPKALGMGMLIRAMGPDIVAVDELGQAQDVAAIAEALRSGVSILSTAHANSLAEARARPILKALLAEEVFERAIILSRRRGPGTVESVQDLRTGRELLRSKGDI